MKKLEDFKVKAMFPGQPVGDPQVSPDGGSILFTHTVTDLKEDKRYTHMDK